MISDCCGASVWTCGGRTYCDGCKNECKAMIYKPAQSTTAPHQKSSSSRNLREETKEWIKMNEKAWELFQHFALDKAEQKKKFGVKALAERVRWEEPLATDGSEFKIPNSYVAYIARELIWTHPILKKYIETRSTKW